MTNLLLHFCIDREWCRPILLGCLVTCPVVSTIVPAAIDIIILARRVVFHWMLLCYKAIPSASCNGRWRLTEVWRQLVIPVMSPSSLLCICTIITHSIKIYTISMQEIYTAFMLSRHEPEQTNLTSFDINHTSVCT